MEVINLPWAVDLAQGDNPPAFLAAARAHLDRAVGVRRLTDFGVSVQARENRNHRKKLMLADSDRVKALIGQDVILAVAPSGEEPGKVHIAVGHLYDYAFMSDIPFGTANLMGEVKFTVSLGADEYQRGEGSWTFPTQSRLQEWASRLPRRLDYEDLSLPAGAQMQEIRNVVAVVQLQDGMKERYYEKANELFLLNREQENKSSD